MRAEELRYPGQARLTITGQFPTPRDTQSSCLLELGKYIVVYPCGYFDGKKFSHCDEGVTGKGAWAYFVIAQVFTPPCGSIHISIYNFV